MNCSVLNVWHPMAGCDIHSNLTAPPPIPPVPVPMPHIVAAPLGNGFGLLAGTVKCTLDKKVYAECTHAPIILQGSDIGPLIAHFALCTPVPFLPLILLGSGSVSEFFASTVKAANTPVAIAVASRFGVNLNCGIFAMPTGIVVAIPSTVTAGFKWGDFLAGLAGMLMDFAISFFVNAAFNGFKLSGGGGIFGALGNRLGPSVFKTIVTNDFAKSLITTALGSFVLLGSPVGYSNTYTTLIGGAFQGENGDNGWGNFKAHRTQEWAQQMNEYFDSP